MAGKKDIAAAVMNFYESPEEQAAENVQADEPKQEAGPAERKEDVYTVPAGFYRVPGQNILIEVKSKRVQLVFKPSLLKAVKAEAKRKHMSMNELVHEALEKYLKEEK